MTGMVLLPLSCSVSPAGYTLYRPKLETYAKRPSGETATSCGPRPVGSFPKTFSVAGSTSANWNSDLQATTTVSAHARGTNEPTTRNATSEISQQVFFIVL